MDIYLDIAASILRGSRRPLSPREILKRGYESEVVPARLYGQSQHKTLQARLSEDILVRREKSLFFRTSPGRFFLREFINDSTVAPEYRNPIIARRRQRELPQRNALAIESAVASGLTTYAPLVDTSNVLKLIAERSFHYAPSTKLRTANDVLVWSFVMVMREANILTYRRGRYREDRDAFVQRRSIGFYSPVEAMPIEWFEGN